MHYNAGFNAGWQGVAGPCSASMQAGKVLQGHVTHIAALLLAWY
jgi:hypothetical protein